MPIYTKVSDAWKELSTVYVKVSDAWKSCSQVYVKVDGVWKPCLQNIEYVTHWGINYGMNYTSNVQVGSVITICFNAAVWVVAQDVGTVLRNTMFIKPYGAYASGNNVWLYNQSSDGDLYYIDIDRRYLKWVSIQYTATSSNPSFDITWQRDESMLNQWGFNIQDDRIEYTEVTIP